MNRIKVLLADDHGIVRKGIKLLLSDDGCIDIVGEASDGEEALKMVKDLAPHVLVADISMPVLSGIEITEIINQQYPHTKVLILSTHSDEDYILKSFEAGAMGYLPKDSDEEKIVSAIKSIIAGEIFYTSSVTEVLARSMIRHHSPSQGNNQALTDRESEILKHIIDGSSNKQIANQLSISIRTVDTHRRNIMEKLRVKNTAELVRVALEKKLIKDL